MGLTIFIGILSGVYFAQLAYVISQLTCGFFESRGDFLYWLIPFLGPLNEVIKKYRELDK